MDPLTSISIGARALGLLKRFWYVLPILAMAAFIYVQSARMSAKDAQLDRAKVTQTQLEDRNRLVQASLDASVQRIKDNNARIEADAKALADQRASPPPTSPGCRSGTPRRPRPSRRSRRLPRARRPIPARCPTWPPQR